MSTLLVINPHSRNGDTECSDIMEALAPLGHVEIHRLGVDDSLAERIESLGNKLSRIIVAGGDGTINSVLPMVLDAGVPMGVLPLGTANDFARSLDIPADPVEAAKLITRDCTRRVDVGVVNDRPFLNAVGIGLGPDLTRQMDKEKKKRLGVLAYLESLVQVLGRRRRRYARVDVEGSCTSAPFMQITVANGRYYGGGMLAAEDAQMDDGLLRVLCVRPLTPGQLLLRGLRIKNGVVGDDEKLLGLKGKCVEINTRFPNDVTADGELITTTPIRCRSLPRALSVFVPEDAADEISAPPVAGRAALPAERLAS